MLLGSLSVEVRHRDERERERETLFTSTQDEIVMVEEQDPESFSQ